MIVGRESEFECEYFWFERAVNIWNDSVEGEGDEFRLKLDKTEQRDKYSNQMDGREILETSREKFDRN